MNPLEAARRALVGADAWLVGGALRDRLLGRATDDVDLVVAGDVAAAARAVARESGAVAFSLSDAFGAWRVTGRGAAWQVDLSPRHGDTIEDDLRRRDFTVNALAEPLAGGAPIDPCGGGGDLRARRLRMVSPEAFDADPLRVMRLGRLALELEMEVEPETARAARTAAGGLSGVAGERILAELRRVLVAPAPHRGLARLDDLGAVAVVLPELDALHGVEQSRYHHLDVWDHTLLVLEHAAELEAGASADVLGEPAPAVAALLAEPLADELTRGGALRLGALLHDVAKPETRTVMGEGRIGFPGHDRRGADAARAILTRLRASEHLRAHVAALARHHLRLGFLVHEAPLPARTVYAYLRACEPVEVDVTVLSVADRLATGGRNAGPAIEAHLELARELLGAALRWRAEGPPAPLVRGDELAGELGLEPGPRLGELLAELEAARYAGEVTTRADALRRARELL